MKVWIKRSLDLQSVNVYLEKPEVSEHPYKAHGQSFTKQLVNGRYFSIHMDDAKKIISRIPKGFRTFEAELTIKTIQRCRLKVRFAT